MINEYRFFHEFFDGQIVKSEKLWYKIFKYALIFASFVAGLVLVLIDYCTWLGLILLAGGLIWNLGLKLNKVASFALSLIVGALFFFYAIYYGLFGNALVYIAVYTIFQLFALTKDYSEGSFIQIRKNLTIYNEILLFIAFLAMVELFCVFDTAVGARFVWFDASVSALMVISALLRNERYFDYYIFRFLSLVANIGLWIVVILEFNTFMPLEIIIMYASYLVFEVVTLIYQRKTYVNEYMLAVDEYKKENEEKIKNQKLEKYKNLKQK